MMPALDRRFITEWGDAYDSRINLLDGFDDAFIGVGVQGGSGLPVAVYSFEAMPRIVEATGATPDEAHDHLVYNVIGGMPQYQPPVIVYKLPTSEE